MNITPVFINQPRPTTDTDRTVGAVRPAGRAQDALQDDGQRRPLARHIAQVDRESLAARAGGLVHPHNPNLSARANRALATYNAVSGTPQRARLETLLGFDDYA